MPARLRPLLARLPLLLLAVGAIVLMGRTEGFLAPATLGNVLKLASIVGVLAVGQAFVLIAGGFDLSQGAMLGLSAAVSASIVSAGYGPVPAALAALAVGATLGAANGLCVAIVRTNAFVTTLSALLIYRGATFVLLGGRPLTKILAFDALDATGATFERTLVPLRAFAFLAVAALGWAVLRWTVFGQHVYATGGNAEAARLAGVRTAPVRIGAFAVSGLAAGLGAVSLLSWVHVAKPDTGTGYELDAIAACVIGGVSLQGGSGSVLGAAAGCLLMQTLGSLITYSGFPDEYRSLVTGTVILTFAAADALARRQVRR